MKPSLLDLRRRHRSQAGGACLRSVQEHQADTLHQLQALVEHPAFGTSFACPELLRACVRECLEAGLPPSQKRLTELLLPHAVFLLDDPELVAVSRHLKAELRRQMRQAQAPVPKPAAEPPVDPVLLEQVRAYTRGRRILFVGGQGSNRCAQRQSLEEALAAAIDWDNHEELRNEGLCAARVERAEIVVTLTKFMGHSLYGIVKRLAREKRRPLVCLPGGLGINNVLRQFAQQLGKG